MRPRDGGLQPPAFPVEPLLHKKWRVSRDSNPGFTVLETGVLAAGLLTHLYGGQAVVAAGPSTTGSGDRLGSAILVLAPALNHTP